MARMLSCSTRASESLFFETYGQECISFPAGPTPEDAWYVVAGGACLKNGPNRDVDLSVREEPAQGQALLGLRFTVRIIPLMLACVYCFSNHRLV